MSIGRMEEILRAAFEQSGEFRAALAETGRNIIAHSVMDTFWGTGLNPEMTMSIDPDFWPGQNKFGILLSKIQAEKLMTTEPIVGMVIEPNSSDVSDSEDTVSEISALAESETTKPKSPPKPSISATTTFKLRQSKLNFAFVNSPQDRSRSSSPSGRRRRATSTPPGTDREYNRIRKEIDVNDNSPLKPSKEVQKPCRNCLNPS